MKVTDIKLLIIIAANSANAGVEGLPNLDVDPVPPNTERTAINLVPATNL